MQVKQSRRDFLAGVSMAAVAGAGLLGARASLADDRPPEVTAVRLVKLRGICLAPQYVAEELLRAEGFTDISYVEMQPGLASMEKVAGGEADFTLMYTATLVHAMDAGLPLTVVAGVHPGCFELFAHEPIQTVSDLKGKKIGIQAVGSAGHQLVAIMAAYVGLDPDHDLDWVTDPAVSSAAPRPRRQRCRSGP